MNREYKDTTIKLFLMEEKGRLVRLVNSIFGTQYPEDIDITDNTLQAPVFLETHNGISFCAEGNLHLMLIEHQATLNKNMAVRMLMHLGRVYEELLTSKSVYTSKRIPLPTPHMVVLYNGMAKCPEVQTLKLSDSFTAPYFGERPAAEVVVQMYNINFDEERMPVLLRKNPELREYAAFIQAARNFAAAGMDKEEALKRAIRKFSGTDVMGPFLEKHASEVTNMLMTEWNTLDYGRVQRAEGRKEGREEGMLAARCESVRALMDTTGKLFEEVVAMLQLTPAEAEECRKALNL